jgi:hypothetical protein
MGTISLWAEDLSAAALSAAASISRRPTCSDGMFFS